MNIAVLANSGGLDSCVVAYLLHKDYELHSLYIGLGHESQESQRVAARITANKYCVSHYEMNLSGTKSHINDMGHSGVPCISELVLSIGRQYCTTLRIIDGIDVRYLATGLKHMGRYRQTFVEDYFEAMQGCWHPKKIEPITPLWDCRNIIEYALEKGMTVDDLKHTVSCQFAKPCGKCGRCLPRNKYGL